MMLADEFRTVILFILIVVLDINIRLVGPYIMLNVDIVFCRTGTATPKTPFCTPVSWS